VSLVLNLPIDHDSFGRNSDPNPNGHLHYPNDIDKSLNESVTDKIRKYRSDFINNSPNSVSFMPTIPSTSGRLRLHSEFVRLLCLQAHRKTDRFFEALGVQITQSTSGLFHFLRSVFSSLLKSKVDCTLTKAACLQVNLDLDGAPITSRTHTHPSHTQTSRLLTLSLS
jgi:hypothetical protein